MWNVYQYCIDYSNNKIDNLEFKHIFANQRPLKEFINDAYKDMLSHNLKEKYVSLGGLIFPTDGYLNVEDFINRSLNHEAIKKEINVLMKIFNLIYKS